MEALYKPRGPSRGLCPMKGCRWHTNHQGHFDENSTSITKTSSGVSPLQLGMTTGEVATGLIGWMRPCSKRGLVVALYFLKPGGHSYHNDRKGAAMGA